MTSWGPSVVRNRVVVGVTACSASTERLAKAWFHQRWGTAVYVQTCQKIFQPFKLTVTANPGTKSAGGIP